MRRALPVALVVLLAACGGNDDEPQVPSAPPTATPTPGSGLIVDHRCTDTAAIPADWLEQVRSTLRIAYGHTSHGSQLLTGALAFRGDPGSPFYFDLEWGFAPGIFFNDGIPDGDLGEPGDLGWRDGTVELLGRPANDRNVVMWSWCGGVSGGTEAGVNAYLQATSDLETRYPAVRFVYMTGHLDGSGAAGNLHLRNEQIRNYCRANGKTLFDFADIESYDPDGLRNYMELYANDACDYDSNGDQEPDRNWASDWLAAHPDHELTRIAAGCEECAHSERLNCVLKGRAAWWLWARIAGWPGP